MAGEKSKEVRAWILGAIKRRAYAKDEPLPGDLELAHRFKVSRGTVRTALDDLRRQGLIERRRGAGTFLSERGTRKSGVIGLLLPEADTCEFFRDVAEALVRQARRYGYAVLVKKVDSEDPETIARAMRRHARKLAVQPVEGVVFRPLVSEQFAAVNREVVRIFERTETPVVLFDSDIEENPKRSACDLVAVNNVAAGRKVAEHLIARGRRRIAFLMADCVPGKNVNLLDRFFGVAGESVVKGLRDGVRSVDCNPEDTSALRKLLRSAWRPDAFVCAGDEVAARLVRALRALPVRVPDDIAVVGFDDVACARSSVPPLTTVRQPSLQIAQTLLKTLAFRIRSPEAPPQEIYLDAPLIVRRTT